jgi:branched-chain amino acid transport system permease protein
MEQFSNILALGLLLGGIYALVSVGLNLIFGVIRIINFAQGEFVMLGMYGAYACYSFLGIDPYVALFLVVPVLGLLGMAVYWFIMRPLQNESMMQVFASFGLLLVLQNAVLGITGGLTYSVNTPLSNITYGLGSIQISLSRLVVLIAAAVVALVLGVFLTRTTFGQAIRAVAQDRKGAQLMGINVERTFMWSFAIGTGLAGLAGVLLTPIFTMSPQIGGNFIMAAFAVVVLGGLGSVLGAFIGGFLVGLTEAIGGYYVDPVLKNAILFSVFIVVLLVKPSGLLGHAGAEEVGLREQH